MALIHPLTTLGLLERWLEAKVCRRILFVKIPLLATMVFESEEASLKEAQYMLGVKLLDVLH